MSGTTPIYALPYPTSSDPVYQGASQMQSLATAIENLMNSNGVVFNGKVNKTGDTMTGDLIINRDGTATTLALQSDAGQEARVKFRTDGNDRWQFRKADSETGSNAGGNLYLDRMTDAGAYLGTSVSFNRQNGNVNVGGSLTAPTMTAGDNTTNVATTAFVTTAVGAAVIDSIADADTTHAPSRNAVFDALALKANLAGATYTGAVKHAVFVGSGAQTLSVNNWLNAFNGASIATWTLPAVSGNTGATLRIFNRGTATLTVQRAGTDQIYTSSAVTSMTIASGGNCNTFVCDGTYWLVM